jgi:hypothetical protein
MAPVVVACFYLTRSLSYEEFEAEYKILFGDERWKETYDACENVYSQLMNDTPGQGARMQVRVNEEDYLFCSEVPDNRKRTPDFLLNSIEKFLIRGTKKATIFSFLSSIDFDNAKIKSDLKNIGKKVIDREVTIFIHTNTAKHSVFLDNKSGKLLINRKPEQRTGPQQEKIECAFYAVCPHASVATAALSFIAKRIFEPKNSLQIEPQHVPLRALIIPFLPLRFGYSFTSEHNSEQEHREYFLKLYSITNTNLAGKIIVENNSIYKCLYDSKYNLLCSDVRYAKQIETKDLIEEICDLKEFLKILKRLCESIDKFTLWPKSFVLLEKVKEYELDTEFNGNDKIALPIIELEKQIIQREDQSIEFKNQLLICSSTDFFEKEPQTSARLLWSLAVGWNPPLSPGNNPYEYPYSKWVKSIVKIKRHTLNKEFGENTWEEFLTIVLLDTSKHVWYWFTVGLWCDVIEDAFSTENLPFFVEFLNGKEHYAIEFINLLEDSNRYKIGNRWQKEIIDQRKANQYLKEICKLLDATSKRRLITNNSSGKISRFFSSCRIK